MLIMENHGKIMEFCFLISVGTLPVVEEPSGSVVEIFKPHCRHCIVSLSKTHYPLLSTGSTQEDPSQVPNITEKLLTGVLSVWFDSLCPSQELWSCLDGQFT